MPSVSTERLSTPNRPVQSEHRRYAADLGMVTEPDLRRFADYWLARRRGRVMPARADLDPVEIGWALSRLYLVDCLPGTGADGGGWRYRYRVAGEEIEDVFRATMGRSSARQVWLDDMLAPDNLTVVMARWRPLPEEGCLIHMRGMIYHQAQRYARGARLMLPLADQAGGPVTGLVGLTVCDWIERVPDPAADVLAVSYIPAAGLPRD